MRCEFITATWHDALSFVREINDSDFPRVRIPEEVRRQLAANYLQQVDATVGEMPYEVRVFLECYGKTI